MWCRAMGHTAPREGWAEQSFLYSKAASFPSCLYSSVSLLSPGSQASLPPWIVWIVLGSLELFVSFCQTCFEQV